MNFLFFSFPSPCIDLFKYHHLHLSPEKSDSLWQDSYSTVLTKQKCCMKKKKKNTKQSCVDDKRDKSLRTEKSLPPTHTPEAQRAAPPSQVALGLSSPGSTFLLFAWYLFDPCGMASAAELAADKHGSKPSMLSPSQRGQTPLSQKGGSESSGNRTAPSSGARQQDWPSCP